MNRRVVSMLACVWWLLISPVSFALHAHACEVESHAITGLHGLAAHAVDSDIGDEPVVELAEQKSQRDIAVDVVPMAIEPSVHPFSIDWSSAPRPRAGEREPALFRFWAHAP